ncbi:hypothetical protein AAFF_G00211230 [Aldrovandia affinis]|uniref:Uncharacterized protein n=1 Tax=Aldrovandia affinis TaxID=143900 RepID=A0AAD7WUU5_9TELE|nr:hypothetical protein AAFF_G00211230 [Aldrovandia affinis]
MLKGRCCVLFSDLKVFLLRPPPPSAPPAALIPMSSQNTAGHANGITGATSGADDYTPRSAPQSEGLVAQPTGGADRVDEDRATEAWSGTAAEPQASLDCSSSSDDCSKEKSEERLSLTSCTDSGIRTPLCRICFQGPEQVCRFHIVQCL